MYCEAVRRDRTQEVAGSSPASSTKERPAKADLLSVLKTALFGEPAVAKLVKWTTFSRARTNCRLPMNDLPSLPCASIGNWTQATATVLACFRGFCASGICHPSPPVAATGLHKGSIQLVPIYLDDGQPSRFTVPVQLPREAIANIERR
jgi:hypothetical protein